MIKNRVVDFTLDKDLYVSEADEHKHVHVHTQPVYLKPHEKNV